MQWHRTRGHDGATVWLRDLILRKARELGYLPNAAEPTAASTK